MTMGRPTIHRRAMTPAERQRRSRTLRAAERAEAEAKERWARAEAEELALAQAKRAARIKAEAERLSFTEWDLTLPFLQRMRHLDELISRRTPYAVSASVNELAELHHLVANARAWLEDWQLLVDRDYQLAPPDFDPDSEPPEGTPRPPAREPEAMAAQDDAGSVTARTSRSRSPAERG